MRPNQQNNKNRSRGRNNNGRKNSNPLSRSFESNGPDVKIRGNAAHIAEKYVQLARDAQASSDSVMAENYLQHAEHYFRILSAAQPQHGNARNDAHDNDDDDDGVEANGAQNGRAEADNDGDNDTDDQQDNAGVNAAENNDGEERSRNRRPRRRRMNENASNDLADAPQPDVGELPAFLTAGQSSASE